MAPSIGSLCCFPNIFRQRNPEEKAKAKQEKNYRDVEKKIKKDQERVKKAADKKRKEEGKKKTKDAKKAKHVSAVEAEIVSNPMHIEIQNDEITATFNIGLQQSNCVDSTCDFQQQVEVALKETLHSPITTSEILISNKEIDVILCDNQPESLCTIDDVNGSQSELQQEPLLSLLQSNCVDSAVTGSLEESSYSSVTEIDVPFLSNNKETNLIVFHVHSNSEHTHNGIFSSLQSNCADNTHIEHHQITTALKQTSHSSTSETEIPFLSNDKNIYLVCSHQPDSEYKLENTNDSISKNEKLSVSSQLKLPMITAASDYRIFPFNELLPMGNEEDFLTKYKRPVKGDSSYEELGSGACGPVCKGTKLSDGAFVAIKEINKSTLPEYQWGIVNGILYPVEYCALRQLQGSNCIIQLLDAFEITDKYIFVLELLDGSGTLADLIGNCGPLKEDFAKWIFYHLIEAVEECYKKGFFHRDLKEQNIMIDVMAKPAPLPKLIDFGISALVKDSPYWENPGTIGYMSPEMCEGFPLNLPYEGLPATVYSLGIILSNMIFAFESVRNSFPIPIVTSQCRHLIDRMLQENPINRPNFKQILLHDWLEEF